MNADANENAVSQVRQAIHVSMYSRCCTRYWWIHMAAPMHCSSFTMNPIFYLKCTRGCFVPSCGRQFKLPIH